MRFARILGTLLLLVWAAGPAAASTPNQGIFAPADPCAGSPNEALCRLGLQFRDTRNLLTGLPGDPTTDPTIAAFLANLAAGNATAAAVAVPLAGAELVNVLVSLNDDPCDGLLADCETPGTTEFGPDRPNAFFSEQATLNILLTQHQQALLGCGEFYGTNCETDGIDLFSAEVSAILQSWVGVTDTTDDGIPQPGTDGFGGGPFPACTRFQGGSSTVLPGCRGPGDPGYDPAVDGSGGLLHPFTGQLFSSEVAALSWNALMTAVALSLPGEGESGTAFFDPTMPYASGRCSFANPRACSAVQGLPGVPEPSTALALGLGLGLLAARRRRAT